MEQNVTKMRQTSLFKLKQTSPLAPIHDGVIAFTERFSPDPAAMRAMFGRQPRRILRLHDGDHLCRFGDPASDFWLIVSGAVRVERLSYPLWRRPGELVGEAAFYRGGGQVRGATMTASGDTSVFRIDRSFVGQLSGTERCLWHETMATVLATKLDEATDQRDELRRERLNVDGLVSRFVCAEGQEAALATLDEGPQTRIDAETCDALVWFSDLAGFSAMTACRDTAEVASLVREVMAIQERAVLTHGGQIDKFMGDGLMAFWRCPGPSDTAEAAHSAVSAALGCAADVSDLFQRRAVPCDLRIGLHAGSVIIGDFGGAHRIAFTMVGQTVNDASRYEQAVLCDSGRPFGRVRLSPIVFDHVRDGPLHAAFEPIARTFSDKHGRAYRSWSSTDHARSDPQSDVTTANFRSM